MKNPINRDSPLSDLKGHKQPLLHGRSIVWMIAAIFIIVMSSIIPEQIFDKVYYRHVFGWIRNLYDHSLGWLPFPFIYLIVPFLIFRIIIWCRQWSKGILFQLSRALGGIAMIIALFYLLWGFNYHQVELQQRLGLVLEKVTKDDIEKEFIRATEVLASEVRLLDTVYKSDAAISAFKITDNDLRVDVERALAVLDMPHKGRVRVRQLWPNGLLLRWSTAGIYIPHAGEGHIDRGLLSIQKPFTIAHEMAHGYGVTDEGACNFIAWLACSGSSDPWIRFGGAFMYWRYAAAEMPDEKVREIIQLLDPVVVNALVLVRENDRKYPDILPQIRDAIYSSYLKQHGVKGGLRSYNYVVMMVSEYLKQNEMKSN